MLLTKLLQKDYTKNSDGYQLKLPLNLETIIPDNDSVRLLSQFVEAMDLTDLYSTYERINSVSPRTLLKIVLYSYMNGDYSSRSMELNCKRDINFMFLLEGSPAPDHATFARFRSIHFAPCSKRILAEMSNALFDMGEISGETIFIDGTKIEASANKYTFVWKKAVTKNQAKLLQKLADFVAECELLYDIKIVYGNTIKIKHVKKLRKKLYALKETENIVFVHGIGKRKTSLQKSIETISRQGQSLLDLVNQLLEVSKVRSEVGEPEWRTGDVVAYIRMLIENYQVYAQQKRVDLRFIPEEMSIMMDFVPEYLCKIIRNLLSNALKFTPKEGRVSLLMSRNKDKLMIYVVDTGVGIDAGDLPHIFDTFYQGENNGGSDTGSGIGLSLVKQMTECMYGHIKVESRLGEGTKFMITLPLQHGNSLWEKYLPDEKSDFFQPLSVNGGGVMLAEDYDVERAGENREINDSMHSSILIVEDNEDVSYYIDQLLKKDYHLLYARNGNEGLEKAKEYMPDLILTDLMMPEMDGYELCREIRHSDILNHIPIIIITAKSEEEDRVRGLDTGADAFLQKPFNADELKVRIVKLLEQRRLLREKYSHALHEGTDQAVELSVADQEFLTRLNDLIYSLMGHHNLNSDLLANKMCMSLSQLNRKVKAITGFSSSGYILQMRMDKAKRLLASTNTPVGDIAMKCGFPEISYFSRMFKQTFQMTPSQYRKKIL